MTDRDSARGLFVVIGVVASFIIALVTHLNLPSGWHPPHYAAFFVMVFSGSAFCVVLAASLARTFRRRP